MDPLQKLKEQLLFVGMSMERILDRAKADGERALTESETAECKEFQAQAETCFSGKLRILSRQPSSRRVCANSRRQSGRRPTASPATAVTAPPAPHMDPNRRVETPRYYAGQTLRTFRQAATRIENEANGLQGGRMGFGCGLWQSAHGSVVSRQRS